MTLEKDITVITSVNTRRAAWNLNFKEFAHIQNVIGLMFEEAEVDFNADKKGFTHDFEITGGKLIFVADAEKNSLTILFKAESN